MDTQIVLQVGNSFAVTIPKKLVKELLIKAGQEVTVEKITSDSLVIKTQPHKKTKQKRSETEFKKWLAHFLAEDGALLDELAHR